jgi:hypothetical protein
LRTNPGILNDTDSLGLFVAAQNVVDETPGCHGSFICLPPGLGGGTSADVNDPTIKIYPLVNQQKAIENCHL